MSKAIFVTATDTGVGKTTVSAALAYILKNKGFSVGYYKPVETGCIPECSDAALLSKITGQNIDEIVLYSFDTPVAPIVAEEVEYKEIQMDKIYSHLEQLRGRYEYLIVEGAGGIKVPITEEDGQIITYLDFVYESSLPVLVVSRAGLGTINHTVLTVDALSSVNADIKGIVLNDYTGENLSEKRNPEIIHLMTGIEILGICSRSHKPVEECISKLEPVIDFIF